MKITYIDQKKSYLYYTDLYRSLCKAADVTLITTKKFRMKMLNKVGQTDVLIFGPGWMSQKDPSIYSEIKGLKNYKKPVVCLLHKPQTLLGKKLNFCKVNRINILVYAQKEYEEYGAIAGVPSALLMMGGDPSIYKPRAVDVIYDIGFSGALHGNNKIRGRTRNLRSRVYGLLKDDKKIRLFWNGSDSTAPRIRSVEQYATIINQSKSWLSTTGPLEDVGPRYFEIGLSKSLIFCNRMDEKVYMGVFKDGKNCVMFENDLSDFSEKLRYYMDNDKERNIIIDNAYNEFISGHTWDHRAKELLGMIEAI